MSEIRLFFAQPIDSVAASKVRGNVASLQRLLEGLPIEIVAPYLDDIDRPESRVGRKVAKEIIYKDYHALDACDIFLVDLSRQDRQAVGMIFEMAYAQAKNKTIVVYTDDPLIDQRIWIIGTADHICMSWLNVRECIQDVAEAHSRLIEL